MSTPKQAKAVKLKISKKSSFHSSSKDRIARKNDPFNKENYGENWTSLASKCKQRDNYSCVKCGFYSPPPNQERLHADHRLPISKGGRNVLNNLVCLCASCHSKKTKNKGFSKLFESTISNIKNIKRNGSF